MKADKLKGSTRGRLEEKKESRGGNQVGEKKGKTCTRRSRTGKKEGKPVYFGAYVKTRFRRTGLVKSEKATGQSSYTTTRRSTYKLGKSRVSQDKSS